MRRFAIPPITAALAFTACNEAAPITAEVKPAAPAMERIGNWTVIPAKSHIKFTATEQGDNFTGEFSKFNAIINFKPAQLEKANVRAIIDLSSVSAGTKDRDGALPGKEWFSVKAFPEAVFQSDDFVKAGEGRYEARGTLSMKGISQPVVLPFTLNIDGSIADMHGQVILDRTLWDVGSGSWTSGDMVGTEVTVDIKVHAESPF